MNRTKSKKPLLGSALLLVTAMIWGVAFVSQDIGAEVMSPFAFNGIRFFIGAAALIPVIIVRSMLGRRKGAPPPSAADRKTLIIGSLVVGASLFLPSTFQQWGLSYTTAGKAGFLSGLYVVFVPIIGLFFGRRVSPAVFAAVALSCTGAYMLCVNEQFGIGQGELLELASAVLWSGQILTVSHYAPRTDCIKLACGEFLVCGLMSLPFILMDMPSWSDIMSCAGSLLYVGLLSCGVAYTIQPFAQRHTSPVVASLIMGLESAFAALSGFLLLDQKLSTQELIGCGLMLTAAVTAQIPVGAKRGGKDAASSAAQAVPIEQ